jgi:hypothetical protein
MHMTDNYPDWLIDAAPGAREALTQYEEAAAERPALEAADRAASAAWGEKREPRVRPGAFDSFGDQIVDFVPKPGVSYAEFDTLTAARAETRAALSAYTKRRDALHQKFEEAMRRLEPDSVLRIAATQGLDAQARAEAALAELTSAIADRDAAWDLARPMTGFFIKGAALAELAAAKSSVEQFASDSRNGQRLAELAAGAE